MTLDSENWLFKKIHSDYKEQFPHIIDRSRLRQVNQKVILGRFLKSALEAMPRSILYEN